MPIKNWSPETQPREKLLNLGPDALSDSELLAIFLRCGIKGKSAVALAKELLDQFGHVKHLLSASQSIFCKTKGLGPAKYAQLQAVLALAKRYQQFGLKPNQTIKHPHHAAEFVIAELGHEQHEIFAALFLNSRSQLIRFEKLFFGSVHGATIYPREIVSKALHYNATSIIFAHNHPSGDLLPSDEDKETTQNLKNLLNQIDIRVTDHFIIASGRYFSFAEHGLL